MARQGWIETLAAATADGTAIANSVTETNIYPGYTFPAYQLQDARRIRITVQGKYSNTGTPTLQFRVKFGTTVLASTGTITTPSGVTNQPFRIVAEIQTRSNGSSGSVLCIGQVSGLGSATAVNLMTSGGATAPAGVTVDLTTDQSLVVMATLGTQSSSNTLTGLDYAIESMN
jgi:hypothetical protein